ncbi:MAG: metallophosphoesterase family protein [Pseudomonadota bacterium]
MTDWPAPAPEAPTYIIGDIHGCADQLSALLEIVDNDVATHQFDEAQFVFVGDYVDRGAQSQDILTFLEDLSQTYEDRVTCLIGNHEEMMLEFLEDPLGRAKSWLRYGGVQTLASFGVSLPGSFEDPSTAALLDASGDLREALGEARLSWLQDLPLAWVSGNLWVVHAGADPACPMDEQVRKHLVWGHDAFFDTPRADGQWIAVGHTVVDAASAENGIITTDTGAVYGHPMTAARVLPDGHVQFFSA